MSSDPFLYPNVTRMPGQVGVGESASQARDQKSIVPGEFDSILNQTLDESQFVKQPLKFSAHATQRLQERKIQIDSQTMEKINTALDQAYAKGVDDALVLTKDAALIVSAKNRTVITALDRNSVSGNVFTNIDGAVII